MSGDYPPFAYEDEQGRLTGFDVDVATAWAAQEGRRLEVVRFRWPELEDRLLAGDFDVAMSGITVRGDRLVRAPMTRSVAQATAIVVVGDREQVARVDEPRFRVAVNRGGHLEKVARQALPLADLRLVDDNRMLPSLLASRDVDAVVTDSLEVRDFEPRPLVARVLRRDRKAYWVTNDRQELALRLNRWLAVSEASGQLDHLRETHFGKREDDELSAHDARIVDLVARRLQVMPSVAETKNARDLAINDPHREKNIEVRAVRAARDVGLDPQRHLVLVRAQFVAAKAVQRQYLEQERGSREVVDLHTEIRPAIDRIDRELREELATGRAAADPALLAVRIHELAPLAGLDEQVLLPLARALK